jgi:hypothetical protein
MTEDDFGRSMTLFWAALLFVVLICCFLGCGVSSKEQTTVITVTATTPDGKQQQRKITLRIVP